jgi:hypothetical protein
MTLEDWLNIIQYRGEVSAKEGLRLWLSILSGQHHYGQHKAKTYYLPCHPWLGEADPASSIDLIGEGGVTAEIGPFLIELAQDLAYWWVREMRLLIFLCETGESNQHMVYFQYEAEGWCKMVGGCTDFSGEGGEGARIVTSIFLLIHRILEIPLEIIRVDHVTYKKGEEMIRKEIEKQWEDEGVT